MLSAVEARRVRVSEGTESKRKSQFGQFLTPIKIAQFMAQLFTPKQGNACHLLDPGAGIGSLSSAFLERCITGDLKFDKINVTAFELDDLLHEELDHTLASYVNRLHLYYKIYGGDFLEEAANKIQFDNSVRFTHAILNPPYKKINSGSRHRLLLRNVGIETVNLYSAFVALSLALMAPGGQIVAIIPRSFCNGPYYQPFRNFILNRAAIRHIHLFGSRNKNFKGDDVLQENIIVVLERDHPQDDVIVSTSTDDSFTDLTTHKYPFDHIVSPKDQARFIHVPTSPEHNICLPPDVYYSLEELGVSVSTGPVVDFRVKEYLRKFPEQGAVPLLYPCHFNDRKTEWPKANAKKPNAIARNEKTEKLFFPKGFYCVVRRFSSKEEKRRIVASIVNPDDFPDVDALGFENHLNVFHIAKQGLPKELAIGLATYLNTTAVDMNFRRFSGHTQVNATDLKLMKYPSRMALSSLGEWALINNNPTQMMVDEQLKSFHFEKK